MTEDCRCICYCEHTLSEHGEGIFGRPCLKDCYCSAFERYLENDAEPCGKHPGCGVHLDGWCYCGDIDASGHAMVCAECFDG